MSLRFAMIRWGAWRGEAALCALLELGTSPHPAKALSRAWEGWRAFDSLVSVCSLTGIVLEEMVARVRRKRLLRGWEVWGEATQAVRARNDASTKCTRMAGGLSPCVCVPGEWGEATDGGGELVQLCPSG